MALSAAIAWELRTDGDNDNGCGYSAFGGTDYTQQAAAELSLTDLAMTAGTTTLTSVTGGFTATMPGNCIYIKSGTSFVQGYYQITAYTNTNTVTIDRDATNGSNASSGSGKVGGARAGLDDAFLQRIVAGNTVWIKAGTYATLSAAIEAANGGTASAYLKLYGYNTTRGDEPTGDNRPLIQCGSRRFELGDYSGDYWDIRHIRFTITHGFGISISAEDSLVLNCQVTAGIGDGFGMWLKGGRVIDCEALAGTSIDLDYNDGVESIVDSCYTHDGGMGIHARVGTVAIFDHVSIDDYDVAWASTNTFFKNCTFVHSESDGVGSAGIDVFGDQYGDLRMVIVINTIFDRVASTLSYAAFQAIYQDYHYLDYNNWLNNIDRWGDNADLYYNWVFTKGPHALAVDSEFVDLDSDNAKLEYTSPVRNTGMVVRT